MNSLSFSALAFVRRSVFCIKLFQLPFLHESMLMEREEGLSAQEKMEAQMLYEKEKSFYKGTDFDRDIRMGRWPRDREATHLFRPDYDRIWQQQQQQQQLQHHHPNFLMLVFFVLAYNCFNCVEKAKDTSCIFLSKAFYYIRKAVMIFIPGPL